MIQNNLEIYLNRVKSTVFKLPKLIFPLLAATAINLSCSEEPIQHQDNRTYKIIPSNSVLPIPPPIKTSLVISTETPSSISSIYVPASEPAHPTNIPRPASTYTPIQVTESTPIPKKKINDKRIVFVSGLCNTYPKDSFSEMGDWLMQNMGFDKPDFDYFNYAPNGKSGERYDAMETLNWISGDGGSAENFHDFLIKLHKNYPTSKFVVISHSMGGNVALYSIATYRDLGFVSSVLTIESPVRGVDLIKANARQLFPCVSNYVAGKLKTEHRLVNPPALYELLENSNVTQTIGQTDYDAKGVHVVNLSNSNDPVLISTEYPSGELGTLPGYDAYIRSFAIDPSKNIIGRYTELFTSMPQQHSVPLLIESLDRMGKKENAEYIGRALRNAVGK